MARAPGWRACGGGRRDVSAREDATLHHAQRLVGQGWKGLIPITPFDAAPATRLKGDDLDRFLRGRGKAPGQHLGNGLWANLPDWPNHPDDEAAVERFASW